MPNPTRRLALTADAAASKSALPAEVYPCAKTSPAASCPNIAPAPDSDASSEPSAAAIASPSPPTVVPIVASAAGSTEMGGATA